jgi:KDO2-lipid IV(A) lauroyltransferase
MRWFPPARRRFDREAKRVFPNMKRSARAKLGQDMGRHMGRTLFEIYHDAEFQTQYHKFSTSGPGLIALKEAQATGKGVIIVSGHFGQWEARRKRIMGCHSKIIITRMTAIDEPKIAPTKSFRLV